MSDDPNRQVPCPGCSGSGDCNECEGVPTEGEFACSTCYGDGNCIDCDGAGEISVATYRELTGAEPPEND